MDKLIRAVGKMTSGLKHDYRQKKLLRFVAQFVYANYYPPLERHGQLYGKNHGWFYPVTSDFHLCVSRHKEVTMAKNGPNKKYYELEFDFPSNK